MNDEVMDELGPIDYLVVEFPAGRADFSGVMAEKLKELVEEGTVRVLDLLIITKDDDGEVDAFELHEFEDGDIGLLRELGAEYAQLLSEEDVGHIAAALEPGTVAAALVWENSWAAPFASSIRHAGGRPCSASPAAASPCRRSSPPPRRPRKPHRRKEPDMPLGPGRRGPGVIGRPVARTAAVVAVATPGRGAPGPGVRPGRGVGAPGMACGRVRTGGTRARPLRPPRSARSARTARTIFSGGEGGRPAPSPPLPFQDRGDCG